MDYDKLNKVLGFSDETMLKIEDFFIGVSRMNIKLSKNEKALCRSIGVDSRSSRILKSHSVSKLTRLPAVNRYGKIDFEDPVEDAICAFYVRKEFESMSDIHRVIYRNKLKYFKKGYNLFYFEGDRNGEYYMALAKGKSDVDMLKWRQTDGINHGIDNSRLIAKIEEWQELYDFVLWGCGRDWLQLFFIHEEPKYDFQLGAPNKKYFEQKKLRNERTPNFKGFASEVAEFCPDLVTQVYGNHKKLIEGMQQINGVYLWWD